MEKLPEIETEAGMAPDLAKNVMAHYSNGDKELPITFYELSPELYQKSGTIIAMGNANGYSRQVMQIVHVTEPVHPADKTLLQKTYDYAADLEHRRRNGQCKGLL